MFARPAAARAPVRAPHAGLAQAVVDTVHGIDPDAGAQDVPPPAFATHDSSGARVVEGRALWIVRSSMKQPASIDSAIARARQIHATDLLVQVRGRGDAFYRSDLVPRGEAWSDTTFDPLAYALDRGHAAGLRVHAWVNVYLTWSSEKRPRDPRHIFLTHPEWFDVTRDGRSLAVMSQPEREVFGAEGAFVAPFDSTARAAFWDAMRELVSRYPVDGLHLDYVRYPNERSGYSPGARDAFLAESGLDPVHLPPGDAAALQQWREFRAAQVTKLVRGLRLVMDAVRPGTLLSAAVIPDPADAFARCGQDWPRWVNEGTMDFVAPMCYGTRWTTVDRQVRRSAAAVPGHIVYAGLAVYNQPAARAAEKVVLARAVGVSGIALFSYDAIAEDDRYWDYLARNVFPDAPRSPLDGDAATDRGAILRHP